MSIKHPNLTPEVIKYSRVKNTPEFIRSHVNTCN